MICTFGPCVNDTVADAVAVTAAPWGGVPVTVAVLTMSTSASIAAWPTVNVAVHVIFAFGANVAGWAGPQLNADNPSNGSVTVTPVSVTLPVFVAVNVYVTSPGSTTLAGTATFANSNPGAGSTIATPYVAVEETLPSVTVASLVSIPGA